MAIPDELGGQVLTARHRHPIDRDSSTSEGYEGHFGLVESPFALTPNPRFLFKSRSITDALDHVTRALKRREALIVVTGETGTGKTMLCRLMLQRLEPRTFVSVITNPLLSRDDLLRQVLADFGVVSGKPRQLASASGHDLVNTLHQFLTSLVPLRAHAVIMIDEAQHLQPDVLEQIRLLSNFETDSEKLLQIILVGQTELDTLLSAPGLRQLEQRISRRHQILPLGPAEVQKYIERRLWIAHGGSSALHDAQTGRDAPAGSDTDSTFWRVRFTRGAVRAIATLSRGLPRVINILCDRSLELGYQRGKTTVDATEVLAAARLLKFPTPFALKLASRKVLAAAAVVIMTAGAVFATSRLQSGPRPVVNAAASRIDATAGGADAPAAANIGTTAGPPAVAPLVAIESFTVVAASFRTAERAASLAGRATELGLPVFTRVTSGSWHQVVVGPYASRGEAREAQEQLDAADIRGTQIIATPPGSTQGASENNQALR